MIDVIFYHGTEIVFVRVDHSNILFSSSNYSTKMAPIDGLKLSYAGVIRQFPELKDRDDWKLEAIRRFKEHVKSMKSEDEIVNYVIKDLQNHGYVAKYKQKLGFRREVIWPSSTR